MEDHYAGRVGTERSFFLVHVEIKALRGTSGRARASLGNARRGGR